MKKMIVFLTAAVWFLAPITVAGAQEYGKIRAMHLRAAQVVKQKNDFVARVLTSYDIFHEVNDQGTVIRLFMDDSWFDVSAIEIVAILKEADDSTRRVTAHDLYFFTADGILHVVTELTVR